MKLIPVRNIKKTPSDPDLAESFSIRKLDDLLTGKDMIQELHRHDYFYVLVLKKGKGNHEIDFTSYKISDHSVFFMRPGQVHKLSLKAGSKGFLMQFNSGFYITGEKASGQVLKSAGNKNHCQPNSDKFKILIEIVETVFQEYSTRQEGYIEVIKACLSIFIIQLVRHKLGKKKPDTITGTYQQQRLDELSELLETHISGKKQVSQYAKLLNLTSYQLNAITKTILGKNCSELISDYIILESKRNLLATTSRVNQIAYQLGFEDVSYFIRFFKKHTGYSPEAFRLKFK